MTEGREARHVVAAIPTSIVDAVPARPVLNETALSGSIACALGNCAKITQAIKSADTAAVMGRGRPRVRARVIE